MDPLTIIGGVGSLLGGLFGKKKGSEEFEKHSTITTEASTKELADPLLDSLKNLFMSSVGGGGFSQSESALSSRLTQLGEQAGNPLFDAEGFARDITGQAASVAGLDLESQINSMLSQSQITESGNSMGALLANKIRNATAANLAGISAGARATGEEIKRTQQGQLTQDINTTAGTIANQILALIQQTRGAEMSGTSKSVEDTKGKGSSSEGANPMAAIGNAFSMLSSARRNA